MYQILIVDDEMEIRNGIANYFPWHELGFHIAATCSDGEEAIRILQDAHIDIVLTDIIMRNMSGLELAEYIHTHMGHVLVYVLSGFPEFAYAQQAMKLGVRQFIVKPTKYQELYSVFSALKKELDAARVPAGDGGGVSPGAGADDDHYAELVAQTKRFMRENLDTATLERAAQHVHMNPSYLSNIFRITTGVCFSDYLQTLRMSKAVELLRDAKRSVLEISQSVGYTSSNNFARAFKNKYGATPSEYRYRLRDENAGK